PGIGGGVCQVSTTLFNAVDRAGLEIVERYRHSQPIDYVPLGRDATISDYLDFKFRNNTDNYILIRSWSDWAITFKIYTHD
ncbi:MAG TPA: VanW family protein, partial [Firmicutes bacterium]|nr:VanW family protein [Bacillota bacterium]